MEVRPQHADERQREQSASAPRAAGSSRRDQHRRQDEQRRPASEPRGAQNGSDATTAEHDQRSAPDGRRSPAPRCRSAPHAATTISAVTGRTSRLVPVAPPAPPGPAEQHVPEPAVRHERVARRQPAERAPSPGSSAVAAIEFPMAMCHHASGSTCGRHVATHAAASTTTPSEPPIGPSSPATRPSRAQHRRTDGRSTHRAPDGMTDCADASIPCRPRHLHPVRRRRARLRDRLVAPARPRLRQHDPGRVGDPHRLLRRDGDRGQRSAGGSPTGSARRCACTACSSSRWSSSSWSRRSRSGSSTRSTAASTRRSRATPFLALARLRAGGPRAGAGDDHDGRDVPGARRATSPGSRRSARPSGGCTRRTRSVRWSGRSWPASS